MTSAAATAKPATAGWAFIDSSAEQDGSKVGASYRYFHHNYDYAGQDPINGYDLSGLTPCIFGGCGWPLGVKKHGAGGKGGAVVCIGLICWELFRGGVALPGADDHGDPGPHDPPPGQVDPPRRDPQPGGSAPPPEGGDGDKEWRPLSIPSVSGGRPSGAHPPAASPRKVLRGGLIAL